MACAIVLLLMKHILLFASLHIFTNYSVFAPVRFSYLEYVYYSHSLPFANSCFHNRKFRLRLSSYHVVMYARTEPTVTRQFVEFRTEPTGCDGYPTHDLLQRSRLPRMFN